MFLNEPLDAIDLISTKATTLLKPDWRQPELGLVLLALHVDMGWFVAVIRVKEEPIWAKSKNRRHGKHCMPIALNCQMSLEPDFGLCRRCPTAEFTRRRVAPTAIVRETRRNQAND